MTQKTELQTKNDFLPGAYQVPDKSRQFMKLEPGDNIIRILSAPLLGYVLFTDDRKPIRRQYDPENPTLGDFRREELPGLKAQKDENGNYQGSRHFWMMLVWDYKDYAPKILEITQQTIIRSLHNVIEDDDWGNPKNFDINIHRQGTGRFDTEFTVTPKPKKDVDDAITEAIIELQENNLLDLNKIWDGGYPFEKYLW